jgi:DNA-binding NarL/FixJ family response regulator
MPGLDGLEATRLIATDPELTDVRIVILTTFALDEYLFDALRFGASGFLVKDTEPADLATAVRVVAQGESLISPSKTRRFIAEFAHRAKEPRQTDELDVITQREREVMAPPYAGCAQAGPSRRKSCTLDILVLRFSDGRCTYGPDG